MKYSCDMIRDLMSLCTDGIASTGSEKAVKEHLSECRNCMEEWQNMNHALPDLPHEPLYEEEKHTLKLIRRIRRHKLVSAVVMLSIGALIGWFGVFMNCDSDLCFTAKQAAIRYSASDQVLGETPRIVGESTMPEKNKRLYWLISDSGRYHISVVRRKLLWRGYQSVSGNFRGSFEPSEGVYSFSECIDDKFLIACYAEDKNVESITLMTDGEKKTENLNENGFVVFEYPSETGKQADTITGWAISADGVSYYKLSYDEGRGYCWKK